MMDDPFYRLKEQLARRGRTTCFAPEDIERIESALGEPIAQDIRSVLTTIPLAGAFTRHQSDTGAWHVLWLAPKQIIKDVTEMIPACVARSAGYMPIGDDASGSGDPFFVHYRRGAKHQVVQIYHDRYHYVDRYSATLEPADVNAISTSLTEFLTITEVEVYEVAPE